MIINYSVITITETKPQKRIKMVSRLTTQKHIDAMVKALKTAGCKVDKDDDAGTIISENPQGLRIFQAIQKEGEVWLITCPPDLFLRRE